MKSFSFPLTLCTTLLLSLPSCQSDTKKAPATPPASAPTTTATAKAGSGAFTTTPSGLRYQVLASGPAGGKSPTINDSVTVHYKGTLTNGTVFDSSYDRGEPATFGVGQVIPGWTEALQLMKPGDEWLLYLPSNIAYGSQGAGASIPPNSDLIFQVNLLRVNGGQ